MPEIVLAIVKETNATMPKAKMTTTKMTTFLRH